MKALLVRFLLLWRAAAEGNAFLQNESIRKARPDISEER